MNTIELFLSHATSKPREVALFQPRKPTVSFDDLAVLSKRAQALLLDHGLQSGDSVLLFEPLSPRLYASIIAILALGATVVLVEPWMSPHAINQAILTVRPKIFLSAPLGFLWGLRSKQVRSIGRWISTHQIDSTPSTYRLHLESVPPSQPGIVVFTSGTTGNPKGVVRQHGYLLSQLNALVKSFHMDRWHEPELCIFPSFALLALALGRPTILLGSDWRPSTLRRLDSLPPRLRPTSVVAGPAFLKALHQNAKLPTLQNILVGGASLDCSLLETFMKHWHDTDFTHVYGSSEAEPVAHIDARLALQQSRKNGYFQVLCLGAPVSGIQSQIDDNELWVAGDHVCKFYLGDSAENDNNKKLSPDGTIWHRMGDRIRLQDNLWWYAGRSHQPVELFQLEQRIYGFAGSSEAFIHKTPNNQLVLVCAGLSRRLRASIQHSFPELREIRQVSRILRDQRHRARIDHARTLKKYASDLT